MADPNIASATTIYGGYVAASTTTTLTSLLSVTADSNKVYKIDTIYASCSSNSNLGGVDICISDGVNDRYIAKNVQVPPESTQIILNRSRYFYLQEGESIKVSGYNTDVIVVYDDIYTPPTSVLETDLILHLDAANGSSYSGTGDTWYDLTSNNYDATRTNSSEVVYDSNGWFDWTDGPVGDTTQGCFTLPGNSFTLGANFTIEVWNYYDAASTPNSGSSVSPWTDGCLWTNSASDDWSSGAGNNNGFIFGYNSFTYRNTSGTQVNVDYTTNPSTQNWHQHVLVVNSGTGTVYVDKSSVATLSNFRTIGQSNGTLGIGIADKYISNYRGEYNGYISIVRIYENALTLAEITNNFDANRARYGL
jgi:hypothetical protein